MYDALLQMWDIILVTLSNGAFWIVFYFGTVILFDLHSQRVLGDDYSDHLVVRIIWTMTWPLIYLSLWWDDFRFWLSRRR